MVLPKITIQDPIKDEAELKQFLIIKRAAYIRVATDELLSSIMDNVPKWIYYNKNNTIIYSMAKVTNTDNYKKELENLAVALVNPDRETGHRYIRKDYVSNDVKKRLCEMLTEYPIHQCN